MMTKQALIEPPQVAAYLRARGWQQSESFCEDKASLWLAPAEVADVDVLLPRRSSVGDYQLRMDALLREVAAVEGRSRQEVLQDLALANADVFRVRLRGGDGLTVPFRDSIKLLRSLQDVFVAAGLAAIEKRAFFTNRKVEKVTEYVAHLQLGHTEQSSFAFTVVSALPAPADDRRLHDGEEPFERQATHTRMQALESMRRAAISAGEIGALEAFTNAVKDGVSANLCDAIVDVTSGFSNHEIEISMRWAATCAAPKGTPDRVVFRKENIDVIDAAGDAFWGMSKDYDTKIEGMISALKTNGRHSGAEAVIVGFADGHARPIKTVFGGEYLGEVIRAYEQRLQIKCEGDLVREHGQYILKNARYFEIAS